MLPVKKAARSIFTDVFGGDLLSLVLVAHVHTWIAYSLGFPLLKEAQLQISLLTVLSMMPTVYVRNNSLSRSTMLQLRMHGLYET